MRSSSLSRERNEISWLKKREGRKQASYGVVCGYEEMSMHEVWKRKQVHEDAWQMHGVEILGNIFGEMEKATFGRLLISHTCVAQVEFGVC